MLSSVASLKMHVMLISQSVIHLIKQKKQLWLHRNDFSCPQTRALTVRMKNYAIHCITLAPLITAIKTNS